jgi:diacylglycerol O-acyltransferase
MIAKIHHAAIDGVTGAALMANLLDVETDSPAPPEPIVEWSPPQLPSALSLFGEGVAAMLRWPSTSVSIAKSLIWATSGLIRHAMHSGVDLVTIPLGAPANRFTSPITSRRSTAVVDLGLPDIRIVSSRLGITINDVVLALCSTALRSYLVSKNEEPDGSLTAVVPVSLRTGKRGDVAGGNQLSAMFVPLASHVHDPVERARAIACASEAAKKQEKAVSWGNVASTILENIPPVMTKGAARAASRVGAVPLLRPANLIVSNVPGPPMALYFGGARLVAAYPLGPIVDGISLNITVQSYLDSLHVGLTACPEGVPDVSRIALGLDDALAELTKATSW